MNAPRVAAPLSVTGEEAPDAMVSVLIVMVGEEDRITV
jgi:hypothetical protein